MPEPTPHPVPTPMIVRLPYQRLPGRTGEKEVNPR
jgi:hypothetical protein